MFRDLIRRKKTPLDGEIDRVIAKLNETALHEDTYPKHLSHLQRLVEVKEKNSGSPVSRDTIVSVAGSILGILLIIGYEKHNVLTSKAFNQLPRAR